MAKSSTNKGVSKSKAKGASSRTVKKVAAAETAPLIVSISGVRGIAGVSLTPAVIFRYITAFVRLSEGGPIVLGNDARPSSQWIVPLIEGILTGMGVDIIQVGLCPTPTIGFLTRKLKAAGGICVTASHNPIAYDGLKFFHSAGEFITADMLAKLKMLATDTEIPGLPEAKMGVVKEMPEAASLHLDALTKIIPPIARKRGQKQLRAIIDCCNSAGGILAPDVVDAYGAEFQSIYCDMKALQFPRGAEPLPENLKTISRAVKTEKADIGFAIDPDADRLALVDEKGNPIGEERTIVLAADAFLTLTKKKSPLVVNLSTTRAIDDLAERHGVDVYRTAIGEANVVAKMHEVKARIGGEGNGGVIVPQVQPGRDSASAIALILLGLQARGGTLSEWNNTIPNYAIIKDSVPLKHISVADVLERIVQEFEADAKLDTTDGVKVSFPDRWFHVRPSNTEPIVRIMVEAPTDKDASALVAKVKKLLK